MAWCSVKAQGQLYLYLLSREEEEEEGGRDQEGGVLKSE
jgi:hypothetical protein